jgi:hypothetical protein
VVIPATVNARKNTPAKAEKTKRVFIRPLNFPQNAKLHGWQDEESIRNAYGSEQAKIAVAIVPDKSCGWRAIIANRQRFNMSEALAHELAKVEQRLRQEYRLVQ